MTPNIVYVIINSKGKPLFAFKYEAKANEAVEKLNNGDPGHTVRGMWVEME